MSTFAATNPEARHRIASLDGLRAVSICMVLLAHGGQGMGLSLPVILVIGNGSTGVSIFFVISGFLITRLLMPQRRQSAANALGDFYLRRAFRILPAFWTFLFGVWLLRKLGVIHLPRRELIASALFVWNYTPRAATWWIGHTWSLCVEEQFYLLWAPLMILLGAKRCRWVAAALIAFTPAVRAGSYFLLPHMSLARTNVHFLLHTRIDTLMFGCAAALCYEEQFFQRLMHRAFQYCGQWMAIVFLFLVSPLLTLLSLKQDQFTWFSPYLLLCGYTLEGICIVTMMVWLIQQPQSKLGRFLNARPIAHLGIISYGMYLWQQLVMTPVDPRPFTHGPLAYLQHFPLNVLTAFLAAELSYRLIERPGLRLRQRLLRRVPPPQVPQVCVRPEIKEVADNGAYRDRTGNLRVANPTLSQLS